MRYKYITQLLNHVYDFRKKIFNHFYKKIKNFHLKYIHLIDITKLNNNDKEVFLREVYGGRQFHLKSNEPKIYKCSEFMYSDPNNNSNNVPNRNCCSQPVTTNPNDIQITNLIETLTQADLHEKSDKITLTRSCNSNCIIPQYWATNLYNNFKTIQPVFDLKFMQNNIFNLEYCNVCSNPEQVQCTDVQNCTDTINVLNYLSIHYQHIRTITRKLYRIRQLNLLLHDIDNALFSRDLNSLSNLTNFNCTDLMIDMNKYTKTQVCKDYKKCEILKKNYEKELNKKLCLIKCIVCNRMLENDKLTTLAPKQLENEILINAVKNFDEIQSDTKLYICRDQCYNQIFIHKKIPIYSHLNKMELIDPPQVISKLNLFERLLIQRAKCFQTIVKLKPYTKFTGQEYVSALKGIAVHLPLSLNATNKYIIDTLPNLNSLNVIINSLPTKSANVWRALVNLDSIYKALEWLQENNHLYKDVDIDTKNFNQKICNTIIDEEIDDNKNFNEANIPYLTQLVTQNIKQYSVIDLNKINENKTDINKYICKTIEALPINDKDINLDHLCFIDIYPTGTGGLYDIRQFKINPAMYIKWILNQANPNPRRNIQYLFSTINNKDIRSIDSGIYASVRTSKIPNMNVRKLKDSIKANDKQLEANLSTTLSAVRGSKEFWAMRLTDLDAFNEKFGPATFFFTLSCNEYHWTDLHDFLIERNIDLDNVNKLNINELCSIDPVSVSFYFEKRIRTVFNKVILDKNGPLGPITHYFRRIEYQARGAPHNHGKLWSDKAPVYGKDSDADVVEYIDKYITCALPNPETEPDLYDLVMKYQVHKCGPSCKRLVTSSNKKSIICRYGFPRPVSRETTLNPIEKVLKSRQRGKNPLKIYNLKRTQYERYINDYNPIILLIWRGNVDIQYIGHSNMVLDKYITAYITKAEKNATEEIWDSCSSNLNLYSALKSFALKSFKQREIGSYEAADKLLGHSLYEFSDQIKWLNALPCSERKRRIKELKEIEELEDENENIYHTNLIDDYYPNRPDELEQINLFDFDSYYDFKKSCCPNDHLDCITLKNNLGYMHKRSKPKVIKTPRIKPIDFETTEKYFHQLIILFKPWRNEIKDLKQNYNTFQEAFESAHKNQLINNSTVSEFQIQKSRFQNALDILNDLKKQSLKENTQNSSNQSDSQDTLCSDDELKLGVNDFKPLIINDSLLEENISNLNSDQKPIFDNIINQIHHQEDHKLGSCVCKKKPEPIRLFCSGVAGMKLSLISN